MCVGVTLWFGWGGVVSRWQAEALLQPAIWIQHHQKVSPNRILPPTSHSCSDAEQMLAHRGSK